VLCCKRVSFCALDPCCCSCAAVRIIVTINTDFPYFVSANGAWSDWSHWSSCRLPSDQTCGIGVRERHRSCSNPEPVNGKQCRGQSTYKEECVRACHKTQWSPIYEHSSNSENQLKQQKQTDETAKNEHGKCQFKEAAAPDWALDQKQQDLRSHSFLDTNLIMIACLAGAAGIALIIFTVVFVYWRSRNNFNYLKKSDSGLKKSQFNANRKSIRDYLAVAYVSNHPII
jgi:hypothetical protein